MEMQLLVDFFLPSKFLAASGDSILPVHYMNESSSASSQLRLRLLESQSLNGKWSSETARLWNSANCLNGAVPTPPLSSMRTHVGRWQSDTSAGVPRSWVRSRKRTDRRLWIRVYASVPWLYAADLWRWCRGRGSWIMQPWAHQESLL